MNRFNNLHNFQTLRPVTNVIWGSPKLEFPAIDESLLDPPTPAERQDFEPFDYTERS
jgi:hypothetical protein